MSEREQGCLNASCHLRIGPPPRQHTNGPCNCLRDIPTPKRIEIERKLAALRAKVERLEGAVAAYRKAVHDREHAEAMAHRPKAAIGDHYFANQVEAEAQLAAVLRETEANTETGRK